MQTQRASEVSRDFAELRRGKQFHPSPTCWEDEVLYFLMLDRFSDGRERGFIGIDPAPDAARATVRWPRGAVSTREHVPAGATLEVIEP